MPLGYVGVTIVFAFYSLNLAFIDVITDALVVSQARLYPGELGGSAELNTFSWTFISVGGIIGSLMAAYFTEKFNPHFNFSINAILLFIILLVSIFLRPDIGESNSVVH